MDLKYITHTQIVEVIYEGHTRQFSVLSVSSVRRAADEGIDDLAKGLESLSIQSKPQVWAVDWDSSVRLLEKNVDHPSDMPRKVSSFTRSFPNYSDFRMFIARS